MKKTFLFILMFLFSLQLFADGQQHVIITGPKKGHEQL